MSPANEDVGVQLQRDELQLIECSLLPGERLEFLQNADEWRRLLDNVDTNVSATGLLNPVFTLTLSPTSRRIWFHVQMDTTPSVSVHGDMDRNQQKQWNKKIQDQLANLGKEQVDFPTYEIVSSFIVPALHELNQQSSSRPPSVPSSPINPSSSSPWHALFTSHHLISSIKRRNLQSWSSSLSISGFAKVGYPGLIYAQGSEENIEEFVRNVKGMQWLALRLRFMEILPAAEADGECVGWKEFQKVGEVVAEMRRLGRETYVTELGIGHGHGETET